MSKIQVHVYNFFRVKVMVFNATFNNISVISWRSVLLEYPKETGVPGENHLMPLSTIFQLYRGNHFFFGGENRGLVTSD
jgi:hypothetical protein